MNVLDQHSIEACADCVMWIANGELPHDNDDYNPERIEANWGDVSDITAESYKTTADKLRWDIVLGGESLGFSHYGCECCGSRLGGDRYELIALLVEA